MVRVAFNNITVDETWLHHYDLKTKQSLPWQYSGSLWMKKNKTQNSTGKVMMTVFENKEVVVMTNLEKPHKLMQKTTNLLCQLKEAFKEKQ